MMENDDTNWFLMLCGVPASGKTTLRERLFERAESRGLSPKVICPDDIRQLVYRENFIGKHEDLIWGITYRLLDYWLSRGENVIYDATNATKQSRKPIVDRVKSYSAQLWAIVLEVEMQEALRRNAGREDTVPKQVIFNMAEKFTPPSQEEGFDEVWVIKSRRGQAAEIDLS